VRSHENGDISIASDNKIIRRLLSLAEARWLVAGRLKNLPETDFRAKKSHLAS
jgi:hypothetical protein